MACALGTNPWAAQYNTWLLIELKLTLKGVVFSFLSFSFLFFSFLFFSFLLFSFLRLAQHQGAQAQRCNAAADLNDFGVDLLLLLRPV